MLSDVHLISEVKLTWAHTLTGSCALQVQVSHICSCHVHRSKSRSSASASMCPNARLSPLLVPSLSLVR